MQSEHVNDPAEPGLRSAGGAPFFKRVAPNDNNVMHPGERDTYTAMTRMRSSTCSLSVRSTISLRVVAAPAHPAQAPFSRQ